MQNKINLPRLGVSAIVVFLLTLIPSCFAKLQTVSADGTELIFGFPFDFYTVKYTVVGDFAVHFNIIGFLANILVVYLVLTLCVWIIKKIKKN